MLKYVYTGVKICGPFKRPWWLNTSWNLRDDLDLMNTKKWNKLDLASSHKTRHNSWLTKANDMILKSNRKNNSALTWYQIHVYFLSKFHIKIVDESRVPVFRPKASSLGRKKLMLDTRK